MRKRFLATLLALIMAMTLLPGTALAEENPSGKIYNTKVYWEFDIERGVLRFSGTGVMGNWGLFNTKPWEKYIPDIRKVVIEPGVTTVGKYAFLECENLTSIELPDTIERIGESAFANCSRLQYIDIPASVTKIEGSVFLNCFSLESILVSANNASYASFGDGALYSKDLSTLLDVPLAISGTFKVPHGVQEIGANAFFAHENISEVVLPNSITKIGTGAFQRSKISSVNIPSNVTEIGDSAFMYCDNIKKFEIPASVKSIGKYAFYASSNRPIKEIRFFGNAPTFGKACFNNGGYDIYYPARNLSWIDDIMQDYGGVDITWIPWNSGVPDPPDPPDDGQLHGKISVSSVYNPSGEKVTLSVTPDPGYRLSSIEVTDGEGNRKVQVSGSGNTYAFYMPAYDVTVHAHFTKI